MYDHDFKVSLPFCNLQAFLCKIFYLLSKPAYIGNGTRCDFWVIFFFAKKLEVSFPNLAI